MENKKYDVEKAKEDCRRHEDALEEAQSCMCGHCHECGFDPSEMKAALDEVERLQRLMDVVENTSMLRSNRLEEQIEALVIQKSAKDARIKELEAEVEAKNKQIRQDIIDKPTEEADWVADYHLSTYQNASGNA